jgi:hypothetical protein
MSRRRKRYQVPNTMTQLGLAWYSREDWERLREIADDRDKLDDTYEDWERQALKMIRCSRYFSRHGPCEPLSSRICAQLSVRSPNPSAYRVKRLHARLLPWSLSHSVVRPIGACWDR